MYEHDEHVKRTEKKTRKTDDLIREIEEVIDSTQKKRPLTLQDSELLKKASQENKEMYYRKIEKARKAFYAAIEEARKELEN